MTVSVTSEIGRLEAVVIGPPGDEFNRMVPANLVSHLDDAGGGGGRRPNPDYLMFDDLVLLEQLQSEHHQLEKVLAAATQKTATNHASGEGVHTVKGLVAASLADDAARRDVISQVLALEAELYGGTDVVLARREAVMLALNATRLTDLLFTGVERYSGERVLRWPIPNALFARDLAAAMGSTLVLTHAARAGRRRDMLLMRAVANHHPLFEGVDVYDLAQEGPVRAPDGTPLATLEGGDIQVLSASVALVGAGIRTTSEAVLRLAGALLARGFESVVQVDLPLRRGAMHIDTVFTQISDDECLVFPPLVDNPAQQGCSVTVHTAGAATSAGGDLLAVLADLGMPLTPVLCGGHDPVTQLREQWSDGANTFALAPGVIVGYARNVQTLQQLGARGYRTVTCEEFIRNAAFYLQGGQKVVVAIEGSELVRGRGGPRCLTMPLRRAQGG